MYDMRLLCTAMRDVPLAWMPVVRSLSIPDMYAMHRWTYQSGECYTCLLFSGYGAELSPWQMRCVATLTFEDEPHAVIGAYCHHDHRRRGYAEAAVRALLVLHKTKIVDKGGIVYASAERWPRYKKIIESMGLEMLEWKW